MKTVHLLIGVPASGKSTWLATQMIESARVVSSDYFIEQRANEKNKTYNEVFQESIKWAARNAQARYLALLQAGTEHLYVDRTNLDDKSRFYWISKAKMFGYTVNAVFFIPPCTHTQTVEWLRRLGNRPGKTIPRDVLTRMLSSIRLPVESEGFNSIQIVNTW